MLTHKLLWSEPPDSLCSIEDLDLANIAATMSFAQKIKEQYYHLTTMLCVHSSSSLCNCRHILLTTQPDAVINRRVHRFINPFLAPVSVRPLATLHH